MTQKLRGHGQQKPSVLKPTWQFAKYMNEITAEISMAVVGVREKEKTMKRKGFTSTFEK